MNMDPPPPPNAFRMNLLASDDLEKDGGCAYKWTNRAAGALRGPAGGRLRLLSHHRRLPIVGGRQG